LLHAIMFAPHPDPESPDEESPPSALPSSPPVASGVASPPALVSVLEPSADPGPSSEASLPPGDTV
jgi:hypothetical protein